MPRTALFLILLALTSPATAQLTKFKFVPGPKPGGGEIKWSVAEKTGSIEMEKDEFMVLQRDVKIEYQDIKLAADKVTVNLRTKDVVAEGHVIIDQGPTRLTANHLFYNLDSKLGTFFQATAAMEPTMYFSGDRIEKIDEDTYRLTNGVFTSCDLDRPAWSFRVGTAEVTLDDYARMRHISFRARDVPVFWAPTLVWPTKRDRSKGLLIPRVRYKEKFGARAEMGYFVPIGDSADATIYADVNLNDYFGTGVEVRYLPTENVKIGDLRAHMVNNAAGNSIEWRYQFRHAQENLPGGFRGVVDVQDYSNLNFFRDYGDDTDLLTLSNIYSSAYLTRNRPKYSLNVLTDRRDYTLLVVNPVTGEREEARQRFEQLPSLQVRMNPQQVGRTPLYFQLESSSSRLRPGGVNPAGERTINADYFRTDLFPTVSMRLLTPQWFSVKPQLSLRQTWYSASLQPECDSDAPPVDCAACAENPLLPQCTRRAVDENQAVSRFYAQGQIETVGPSFSKVFNKAAGGFSRFKHVIEPRVRYVYTTNVENQSEIVRFDTVDTPFLPIVQNSVEYSLTQRIIGKESGPNGNAREVLSFALRQSVALSDPFPREGSTFTTAGEHDFTPLFATLRFNPYQSVTVDATTTFGNISHQIDSSSLSANLVGTGKRADKYLGFTWFASYDPPGFTGFGSSQIRLNAGSFVVRDRVRADVSLNFDAKTREFLEQRYVTGWTGSCWGIAVEYRRYRIIGGFTQDEARNSYGLAITLKNVGTIGTH